MWVGRDNQEIADSLPYLFFLLTWQVGCFEVDQTEVTIVKTKIYTPVFKNVVNLKIYIKYIYIYIYVKILFEFADMHTRNKPRISASQY